MNAHHAFGLALVTGCLVGGTVGVAEIGANSPGWASLRRVSVAAYEAQSPHRSGFINLAYPTEVAGIILSPGQYVIVHNDARMAAGLACSTFYCLDPLIGWKAVVSFHCKPVLRPVADTTKLTFDTGAIGHGYEGVRRIAHLVEYQLPGEAEGHAVP